MKRTEIKLIQSHLDKKFLLKVMRDMSLKYDNSHVKINSLINSILKYFILNKIDVYFIDSYKSYSKIVSLGKTNDMNNIINRYIKEIDIEEFLSKFKSSKIFELGNNHVLDLELFNCSLFPQVTNRKINPIKNPGFILVAINREANLTLSQSDLDIMDEILSIIAWETYDIVSANFQQNA